MNRCRRLLVVLFATLLAEYISSENTNNIDKSTDVGVNSLLQINEDVLLSDREERCESDKQMAVNDIREAERALTVITDEIQRGLESGNEKGYQNLLMKSLIKLVRLQIPLERALSRLRAAFDAKTGNTTVRDNNKIVPVKATLRLFGNDMYFLVERNQHTTMYGKKEGMNGLMRDNIRVAIGNETVKFQMNNDMPVIYDKNSMLDIKGESEKGIDRKV